VEELGESAYLKKMGGGRPRREYANNSSGDGIGVDGGSGTGADAADAFVCLCDLPNDAPCMGDQPSQSMLWAKSPASLVVI
jgi:hypothetical protein